ncbi:MAG: hypothetical protein RL693_1558 [Verrucomicrobiota bacterium]|jgi:hypothetical protein
MKPFTMKTGTSCAAILEANGASCRLKDAKKRLKCP